MNFEPFFEHYQSLVRQVDAAFEHVKAKYSGCVRCNQGCADCCQALFDLTLIEALYIKNKFDSSVPLEKQAEIIEHANKADRAIVKIKRQAFKDHEAGKAENDILEEMAEKRVVCPALSADNRCEIYEFRPITCRLYGVPTEIGGRAHTCGISGFEKGVAYPTAKLDLIYRRLYEISFALAQDLQSQYPKLSEMLVPLSMALLTDYTEEYLGVKLQTNSVEEKKP